MDKVLVPLDRSPLAENALPHVTAISQTLGSRVVLLHVLENDDAHAQVDPFDWHLQKVEAKAYLDTVKKRLFRHGVRVESVLLEGPAAARIIEYEHENNIDLIVLSSHGQSGLSNRNVGSVVQKVVDLAGSSIMIVRPPSESMYRSRGRSIYRRILVPLDGSQRAEYVLPMATRLARYHQAELLVAHMVTRPQVIRRTSPPAEDTALVRQIVERNRLEATRYLEQLQSHLSLKIQTRLLVSDRVTNALHNLVAQEAVDLVLLSAHGYSGENQRPYGNVTGDFIAYGTTSLLIFQDLPRQQILWAQTEQTAQASVNSRYQLPFEHVPPVLFNQG